MFKIQGQFFASEEQIHNFHTFGYPIFKYVISQFFFFSVSVLNLNQGFFIVNWCFTSIEFSRRSVFLLLSSNYKLLDFSFWLNSIDILIIAYIYVYVYMPCRMVDCNLSIKPVCLMLKTAFMLLINYWTQN